MQEAFYQIYWHGPERLDDKSPSFALAQSHCLLEHLNLFVGRNRICISSQEVLVISWGKSGELALFFINYTSNQKIHI